MKKSVIFLICWAAVLLLAGSFALWRLHRFLSQRNPREDLLTDLEPSQVESIRLVVRHPAREAELSEDEQAALIPLLNQIKLGTVSFQADSMLTGYQPVYHAFRVTLRDGTDFILQAGSLYLILWPDAEAYFYSSPSKRLRSPETYPMRSFSDSAYWEILDMGESLTARYFP